MPKHVGKYELGKTLGEGTFGKVKRAVNTETKKVVAIKILDKEKIQKQNMGSQVKKEISIMKMVHHTHVVKLLEVLASRSKIFIVLELVTGGELFDKIVEERRFDETTARFYFQQLVEGVLYCHEQGVCHRDLKPENLLLDAQDNLKISDFGLSAIWDNGDRAELLHTTCGTPNYVAPEVLADRGYDGMAADTWSCGVILFVFLAGYLPFDEPTMSALFRKIQRADFEYPNWFTDEIKELLDQILVPNPATRLTLQQIKAHPWYNKDGPYAQTPEAQSGAASEAGESKGNASAAGLVQSPSAADMDAAIAEGVEEKGADEDDQGGSVAKRVNAFDLINACGGTALNRMFQSADEIRQRKVFMFSSQKPAEEIGALLQQALTPLGSEVAVTPVGGPYKLKVSLRTGSGLIFLLVNIRIMSEEPVVQLVEISRMRGDILSYTQLCNQLQQDTSATGLAQILK